MATKKETRVIVVVLTNYITEEFFRIINLKSILTGDGKILNIFFQKFHSDKKSHQIRC